MSSKNQRVVPKAKRYDPAVEATPENDPSHFPVGLERRKVELSEIVYIKWNFLR